MSSKQEMMGVMARISRLENGFRMLDEQMTRITRRAVERVESLEKAEDILNSRTQTLLQKAADLKAQVEAIDARLTAIEPRLP